MSGAWLARRRIDQRDRWSCSAPGSWARRCGQLPALAALPLEVELRSAAGSFVEWLGGARLFAAGRWRRSPLLSQGRDGAAAAPTLPPRNGLLCLALSVVGTWYSEWTFVRVRTRLFSNSY